MKTPLILSAVSTAALFFTGCAEPYDRGPYRHGYYDGGPRYRRGADVVIFSDNDRRYGYDRGYGDRRYGYDRGYGDRRYYDGRNVNRTNVYERNVYRTNVRENDVNRTTIVRQPSVTRQNVTVQRSAARAQVGVQTTQAAQAAQAAKWRKKHAADVQNQQ